MSRTNLTIVRAFELADGGTCHTITEIRKILKAEGYESVDQHFEGAAVKKQLYDLMNAARAGT